MRKIIFTIWFITITAFLFAQTAKTTIGIKLYPGFSTYKDISLTEDAPLFSLSGGIEVRQHLFRNLIFLETGMYVFNRGIKFSLNATDQNGNFIGLIPSKDSNQYLMVPVLAIFKFKNFQIGAGVHGNYYLSRKFTVEGEVVDEEKNLSFKKFTLGIQFVSGYEFTINDRLAANTEVYLNQLFKDKFINYGAGIGLRYKIN